jgi:hypothetical protein
MDTVAEFLFGIGGLTLLAFAALAWVAVFLMWLKRRQIKETT